MGDEDETNQNAAVQSPSSVFGDYYVDGLSFYLFLSLSLSLSSFLAPHYSCWYFILLSFLLLFHIYCCFSVIHSPESPCRYPCLHCCSSFRPFHCCFPSRLFPVVPIVSSSSSRSPSCCLSGVPLPLFPLSVPLSCPFIIFLPLSVPIFLLPFWFRPSHAVPLPLFLHLILFISPSFARSPSSYSFQAFLFSHSYRQSV